MLRPIACTFMLGAVVLGLSVNAGASPRSTQHTRSAESQHGGSVTVLENSLYGSWTGLDPVLSVAAGSFMNAIYGNLFEIGPKGQLVDDLATGYTLTQYGRVFTMTIRKGVEFSDGTPFNAAAVVFSIDRDINPANACSCAANLPIASATATGPYTVKVTLTRADGSIPYAFADGGPADIVSPTALQKEGTAQFALNPVGAGPFEVVSDVPGSKLVLTRNPHYWQKGMPYLDSLTFETTASDETAYDAILSGQAQAYEDMTTYSLLPDMRQHVKVTEVPSALGTFVVQLNTKVAPFNNELAREAIYYATNAKAISKGLTDGVGRVTETATEPGGLFFIPSVQGYRSFDLAKAKALVAKLGGLSVTLFTGAQEADQEIEIALKDQWDQAGIQTTISYGPLAQVVENFKGGKWQAFLQQAGGFSPALGVGLPFRFESTGPYSGIDDPGLDNLILTASERIALSTEAATYKSVFSYIAEHAYAPFLFVAPQYDLAVSKVSAPGLTTDQYEIFWQAAKA